MSEPRKPTPPPVLSTEARERLERLLADLIEARAAARERAHSRRRIG